MSSIANPSLGVSHGKVPGTAGYLDPHVTQLSANGTAVLWTHLLLTLPLHSSVCRPHLCPQVEGHVSINF